MKNGLMTPFLFKVNLILYRCHTNTGCHRQVTELLYVCSSINDMPPVLSEIKNGIAFITLNRPEKFNAFNREMALLLQEKLDACKTDAVRSVYITGAGKAFSAGQDLAEVVDPNGPGMQRILSEHYNPIVTRIRELEKPVVAAVNGVAAGAGANIALCCDVVVAADSASFIQAFSKIGLIPDSGGTHTLPRLIGWQKASALMMLGDKVTAMEAERIGMIYKVFAADTFHEEAVKIATTLSQMPTRGLAYTKQVLSMSFTTTFEEQLNDEDVFQQKAAQTDDYKEGVAAFLEKRQPVFKGK
jgi:2-(1,2-epoxy-1,2-dihydrophenyl)acetyl-CoA isomerase